MSGIQVKLWMENRINDGKALVSDISSLAYAATVRPKAIAKHSDHVKMLDQA